MIGVPTQSTFIGQGVEAPVYEVRRHGASFKGCLHLGASAVDKSTSNIGRLVAVNVGNLAGGHPTPMDEIIVPALQAAFENHARVCPPRLVGRRAQEVANGPDSLFLCHRHKI